MIVSWNFAVFQLFINFVILNNIKQELIVSNKRSKQKRKSLYGWMIKPSAKKNILIALKVIGFPKFSFHFKTQYTPMSPKSTLYISSHFPSEFRLCYLMFTCTNVRQFFILVWLKLQIPIHNHFYYLPLFTKYGAILSML